MAGVELNPGPINPGYEESVEKQEQAISAPAQNITEEEVPLLTKETEAAPFMQPLAEPELAEFAEFIIPENQERIAVMLGSNLDKVEMLRSKHRENVTGVSIDLLIDWMRCNPQPTNRLVS